MAVEIFNAAKLKAEFQKHSCHLLYLARENVAQALFVSQVSLSTKLLMVAAMAKEDSEDESKRVTVDQITISNKNLEDFVSTRS